MSPAIPLDVKALATAVLLGLGGLAWRWLRSLGRLRGDVHRLQRGMVEQNRRQRMAYDVIRRLAFQVQRVEVGGRIDNLELLRIRAKVDDVRDQMWGEEGNEPRRKHRPLEGA